MSKGRGGKRMGGPAGMPGGQAGMLRQIQKMQEDMAAAQQALAEETIEVSVGGGAVKIVVTGHQRIQSITIDKEALDLTDEAWLADLQDLLVLAVNQAIEQSQARAAERMESITGGLAGMMPGGLGDLFG